VIEEILYFGTSPSSLDPERRIIVEINISNLVVMSVLLQYDNDSILYPMAYFSRKHSPVEINYEIYDKRLLTIV
jgi:hypothetical protein